MKVVGFYASVSRDLESHLPYSENVNAEQMKPYAQKIILLFCIRRYRAPSKNAAATEKNKNIKSKKR